MVGFKNNFFIELIFIYFSIAKCHRQANDATSRGKRDKDFRWKTATLQRPSNINTIKLKQNGYRILNQHYKTANNYVIAVETGFISIHPVGFGSIRYWPPAGDETGRDPRGWRCDWRVILWSNCSIFYIDVLSVEACIWLERFCEKLSVEACNHFKIYQLKSGIE